MEDRRAVEEFYDSKIPDKLRDYVEGNDRILRALSTIERAVAGRTPAAVLDLGCGVGQVANMFAGRWPTARVVGVDPSLGSIATARQLFRRPNLSFVTGTADDLADPGPFELVVLMDVFEHISPDDRPALTSYIASVLAPQGVVVLTVPTPAFQRWLKTNSPTVLQPVDEDIHPADLVRLATAVGGRLTSYDEVSVWRTGDYAHAVISMGEPQLTSCDPGVPACRRVAGLIARLLPPGIGRRVSAREHRRQVVAALPSPVDG